jgi:uncharacterized protein (DUF934 family)
MNSSVELQKSSKNFVTLANDADPRSLDLNGVDAVALHFPKFTDGRAFSQAFLLRRRLGFGGTIRATGEVLVDQLLQMQRAGFTEAVLSPGQDLAVGQRLLAHYAQRCGGHYQGDAVSAPLFAQAADHADTHIDANIAVNTDAAQEAA